MSAHRVASDLRNHRLFNSETDPWEDQYPSTSASGATVVDTVAAMQALTSLTDGQVFQTLRYSTSHAYGDGSGNLYRWVDGDSTTADGGFVVSGTGGRFHAVDKSVANVMQFGAVGDGATDDTEAIHAAIDAAAHVSASAASGRRVRMPKGNYLIETRLDITTPVAIEGDGWCATVLLGSVDNDYVLHFQHATFSTLADLAIVNTVGSGVRFTASHKSAIRNVYAGRGIRDVAVHNDGCQQLRIENVWSSNNSANLTGGNADCEIGFLNSAWAYVGATVATPNATGLDGTTLTLELQSSDTVTVDGDTLQDVADAINSATQTHGMVATIRNGNQLYILSQGWVNDENTYDSAYDYDMIFADGTGSWSDCGVIAGTYSASNASASSHVTNGTSYSFCHAEGPKIGQWSSCKHQASNGNVGRIYTTDCVFQGADTYNIVAEYCHFMQWINCHTEAGGTKDVKVSYSSHVGFKGGLLGTMDFAFVEAPVFDNVRGSFDLPSTVADPTFIGCNLDQVNDGVNLQARTPRFIGCLAARGYSADVAHKTAGFGDNTGAGEVLNWNGQFAYWNAANTLPVAYSNEGGITITRVATAEARSQGTICRIRNQANTANAGLAFSFPGTRLPKPSMYGIDYLWVAFAAKRHATLNDNDVGVVIDWGNGNTTSLVTSASTVANVFPAGTWVYRSFGAVPPTTSDLGTIKVYITPGKAGTANDAIIDVDELVVCRGAMPRGYASGQGDAGSAAMIGGRWVDYGSAAPSSGLYLRGSVRFNTGATAGGTVGWVCVTEGSPGTWKAFGAISA